jgi:hypothetical protein
MDFIMGLPLTGRKLNSIWVHTFYRAEKYAELYLSRILCLHGVLKTIISDRGP